MKAEVKFSTGRSYLEVDGVVLIMQGDPCRDPDWELSDTYNLGRMRGGGWDTEDLRKIAAMLNRGFGNEEQEG